MDNLNKVMNVFLKVEQDSNKQTPYRNAYFLSLGLRAYYILQSEVQQTMGVSLEQYLKDTLIVNPTTHYGENCFCISGKDKKMGWLDSDTVVDLYTGR